MRRRLQGRCKYVSVAIRHGCRESDAGAWVVVISETVATASLWLGDIVVAAAAVALGDVVGRRG